MKWSDFFGGKSYSTIEWGRETFQMRENILRSQGPEERERAANKLAKSISHLRLDESSEASDIANLVNGMLSQLGSRSIFENVRSTIIQEVTNASNKYYGSDSDKSHFYANLVLLISPMFSPSAR